MLPRFAREYLTLPHFFLLNFFLAAPQTCCQCQLNFSFWIAHHCWPILPERATLSCQANIPHMSIASKMTSPYFLTFSKYKYSVAWPHRKATVAPKHTLYRCAIVLFLSLLFKLTCLSSIPLFCDLYVFSLLRLYYLHDV
jgi:hypothetical protein